ncbi:MAG: TrkA family potassium uptake protein [Clostridiales bacterium]|nr:TrkA family potassium uptake protein [Clostridiales bacterium]
MKTRIFLIGGFQKTKFLAKSLLKKGYHVTAINKDTEKCVAMAEIENLTVFNGDGTKPFVLEDADAYNADIAIALTEYDADNLVICELCKKKFHIKKTVALISDPKKTEFFYRMGIDSVVCAITAVANIIEQQTFLDEMATLVPIGEGRVSIAQIPIAATAPAVGKKLWEINLPKGVIVGCVLRGEQSIVPQGDTRILTGDVLVLISSNKQQMAAIKELTGR